MLIFEGLVSHEGKQYRYKVSDLGKEIRKLEIFHPDGNTTIVTYDSGKEEFKDVFESALKQKGGGKNLILLLTIVFPI